MIGTPAHRDPRRAAVAAAFVTVLVAGPALAWIVRGAMPPPVEARTFEGRYTLHNWSTTSSSATPSGPIRLTIDPKTGKGTGWATGPIGSVRLSAQMNDRNVDMIAFGNDGESLGVGAAHVIGDAMTGSFGVPKMAASAGFVVETKR